MVLKLKKNQGFTLVELMVVIAVIVIISIIVIVNIATARTKSRDTMRITDVKQLQGAIQSYFSTNYVYPNSLSDLSPGILTSIPKDPSTKLNYGYATSTSPVKFHVCATLELNTPTGRAGIAPIITGDPCNGTIASVFDLIGGV